MAWDTAANIINDAAVELGLISADIAAPYSSANRNIIQLCRLLKGVGQDLVKLRAWTHLQKEHTFSFVSSQADYSPPTDFGRVIDQTFWNRSNRLPLGGPVDARHWQLLKAVTASGVLYNIFRTVAGVVRVYPTPTTTDSIAFEYISTYWVEPVVVKASLDLVNLFGVIGADPSIVVQAVTGGPAGNSITIAAINDDPAGVTITRVVNAFTIHYKASFSTLTAISNAIAALAGADKLIELKTASTGLTTFDGGTDPAINLAGGLGTVGAAWTQVPTIGTDTLYFDRRLLVAGAKLYFLRQKGFDTTAAEQEWGRQLSLAGGADGAARAIRLCPVGGSGFIGSGNLPETGYGS